MSISDALLQILILVLLFFRTSLAGGGFLLRPLPEVCQRSTPPEPGPAWGRGVLVGQGGAEVVRGIPVLC